MVCSLTYLVLTTTILVAVIQVSIRNGGCLNDKECVFILLFFKMPAGASLWISSSIIPSLSLRLVDFTLVNPVKPHDVFILSQDWWVCLFNILNGGSIDHKLSIPTVHNYLFPACRDPIENPIVMPKDSTQHLQPPTPGPAHGTWPPESCWRTIQRAGGDAADTVHPRLKPKQR